MVGVKSVSLCVTGLALAALIFCGCSSPVNQSEPAEEAAAAAPAPTPWRLACRVANYGAFQEDAFKYIQELGLHYVFMSIPKAEEVEAVKEQLAAFGLEVLVVRGDTNLSQESAVAELGAQFEICKQLGVKYMFLSPKRHDAPFEVVYERLREAGDLAEENDVILVLETHPDLGTNGAVHVETMNAIDHSHVRVNFDTGNISYYNENTDAPSELEKCVDYVATFEVKDHNGALETWNFPALGEGIVDFPAIFKILRSHAYTGPITIEVEGVEGVEWTLDDIQEALKKSVASLRTLESFQ